MLSYYTFASKTVIWWKKLFLHLFNLAAVNAYILHNKSSKEKMSLEIFYKKVAKGLLASADMEIQALRQTSSPHGRLVGTDHFLYGIPATQATLKGKTQHSCRKRQAPDRENCDEIHYNVLQKM
jgi:maltodextrin utilization protein YvdJ